MTVGTARAGRWLARVPVDLLFLLGGTLSGGWVLLVLLLFTGSGAALLVVVPVVAASVRLLMPLERLRLRLLGMRVPVPAPVPDRPGLVRFLIGRLDARQAGYLLLLVPVGLACGSLCLAVWSTAVYAVLDGDWSRASSYLPVDRTVADEPSWSLRVFAALVLVPVAAGTSRLLADAQAWLAAGRLDPARRARVEDVLVSRAKVVDAQTAELRRIERDLHDGAQARIVALHIQLAMVGRALDPLGPDAAAARQRLAVAAETARCALSDLRHLVRGIHPPILTDRGLDAALTALAVDLPVTVDLDLGRGGDRLAPAVEAAAYFTVAEALANVAKHAATGRCRVTLDRAPTALRVSVHDDGPGGADPDGAGLSGLRHRLEALDGRLTVHSPIGGPTTVRAELPCA